LRQFETVPLGVLINMVSSSGLICSSVLNLQCGLAHKRVNAGGRSHSLTAMPLLRRNEFDAAIAVLMVVPINKGGNPFADLA